MRKFYRVLMSSIALMVMFVLGMSSASAIPDAPPSVIPVVDESGTLDAQSLMTIGKIADIDSSDVKVYTYIVPELPDEYTNIDEAARETLNAWGLSNSGVLIYIAKADGEISVQVGERWQEALSNDMERIISETIVPSLSEDNYSGALTSGISEIKQAADSDSPSAATQMQDRLITVLVIVFAVMIVVPAVIALIAQLIKAKAVLASDTQTTHIPSTTSDNKAPVRTVPQTVAKDTKEKMRDSVEQLQMTNPALFYAVLSEIEEENHNNNEDSSILNSSIDEHTTNYDSDSNNYSSSSYDIGSSIYDSYSSIYDSSSSDSYSSSYNSDFGSSYSSSYSSDFGSSDSGGSDSGGTD